MKDSYNRTATAVQLALPLPDTNRKSLAADYGFPEQLMGWLSRHALHGSAYVRLDASCDGSRGSMIVTSYDEHDRAIADETFDLHATDYLMAS